MYDFKEFFDLKNPEKISNFIEKEEKVLELLEKIKPYLKETFPHGKFELDLYCDLSGEENHHLLLNIYVDDYTFNNGFMDKILDVDMKILPIQKEMGLLMALNLMPGVKEITGN